MSTTFLITAQDVQISSATGRPMTISDGDKLSQDLKELFDTNLDSLIGLVTDPFALRAALTQQVRQLVTSLQQLQQQYQPEARPPEERIAEIAQVLVNQVISPGDVLPAKTAYTYQVDILTDAATEATSVSGAIIGTG